MKEKEPLDRNKTALTHKLTALGIGLLATIGCKPIETEVPVGNGIIVDVAGFTYPSMTELKRGKLLKSAILDNPLLKREDSYTVVEYLSRKGLFPLTAVVEVKISLADFKKDLKRKFSQGIADLNYIIVPRSIKEKVQEAMNEVSHYDYYYHWSIIEASDSGGRILKSDIPRINEVPISKTLTIISNIAIRRCHRTEYVFMRSALKQYRVDKKPVIHIQGRHCDIIGKECPNISRRSNGTG